MDFALASNGASVMMATANDDNHPSENLLDGKDDTFWTTTGLFPHEVVIKLSKRESISKVRGHASFTTIRTPDVALRSPVERRTLQYEECRA